MKHLLDAGPAQEALYRAHVGVGLAVLALTAFRLVWLIRHRPRVSRRSTSGRSSGLTSSSPRCSSW